MHPDPPYEPLPDGLTPDDLLVKGTVLPLNGVIKPIMFSL